jgi:AraC-like DNA-binding protein
MRWKGEICLNCKFEFIYSTTHKNTEYINFHKHNCFELVYYLAGLGHTTIGEKEYKYSKNSYSIIFPNTIHDESYYSDTSVLFVGFSLCNTNTTLSIKEGIYGDEASKPIFNILEEIRTEFLSKQNYYELKLNLLVTEMLIELHRLGKNKVMDSNEMIYIKKFIYENYNQNIDLKTLAELSGYSYHYFRHKFKDKVGVSPINYIINIRIEMAKHLLVNTKFTIASIAQECGFSDQSQFSSIFKRKTGYAPRDYRNSKS